MNDADCTLDRTGPIKLKTGMGVLCKQHTSPIITATVSATSQIFNIYAGVICSKATSSTVIWAPSG